MQRRIMGMENELGAIRLLPDGSWVSVNTNEQPLKSILAKLGARSTNDRLYLANGGCVYPDVGHVEYATPECLTVRDVIAASCGGERWIEKNLSRRYSEHGKIIFMKDNADLYDRVSFGCHENYFFDGSKIPFCVTSKEGFPAWCEDEFATFLATRIVFTGGGVATAGGLSSPPGRFLLSHRARFIGQMYDAASTAILVHNEPGRPLITTKTDEPLGRVEGRNFQRLHLSCGDPNMSEVADFLKFGTMHLLLRLAEETHLKGIELPAIKRPLTALKMINTDPDCRRSLAVRGTAYSPMSALDIQEAYLEAIARHFPRDDDHDDVRQECQEIITRWADVLSKLRRDPRSAVRDLDWVHKMVLEERWLNAHGVNSFEHLKRLFRENRERAQTLLEQLKGLEQRYHELSLRGLWRIQASAGRVTRLITDEEIAKAAKFPPGMDREDHRTRSWARGMMIAWAEAYKVETNVSWQAVSFNLTKTPCAEFQEHWRTFVSIDDPFTWRIPEVLEMIAVDG